MRLRLALAALLTSASFVPTVSAIAQEGSFTFRWHLFGRGGDDGGIGPGGPGGPGPETVIIDIDDEGERNVDPGAPEPELSLVATTGNLVPNASRVIHQCFQAAGGYQNYSFTMDAIDSAWVEAFDLVLPADINNATMPRSYVPSRGTPVAPYLTGDGERFTVSGSGSVCMRIKVAEGAANYNRVQTAIFLDDYPDSTVAGGSIAVGDMWTTQNFLIQPVAFTPQCPGGCTTDDPGPPPELVLSASGGSVSLSTLTYMGFGWGYGPGPGFNPTPNIVDISGGLPPYHVEIQADAMGSPSPQPHTDGCRITWGFFGIPPEFYPGDGSAVYNATITVRDAANQVKTTSISYSISGLSSGGYGGAGPGGYYQTIDPASQCGWTPPPPPQELTFGNYLTSLEEYVGAGSTPFNIQGGTPPYRIEGMNLPDGITVDMENEGTVYLNTVGTWTGPNALRFRLIDAEGE